MCICHTGDSCRWKNRPLVQISRCTSTISHNAPFCNRSVHMCAHFCYKMLHYAIYVKCIVGFVKWPNYTNDNETRRKWSHWSNDNEAWIKGRTFCRRQKGNYGILISISLNVLLVGLSTLKEFSCTCIVTSRSGRQQLKNCEAADLSRATYQVYGNIEIDIKTGCKFDENYANLKRGV